MRCSTFQDFGRKFSFLLGLGSVLCCVMHAQTVRTSFQPGLIFSNFHTYRWVQIKGVHPDPNWTQKKKNVTRLAKKKKKKKNGAARSLC